MRIEKPVPPGKPSQYGKGHGTGALGPSDSSDTGSDVLGGPGLSYEDLAPGLDRGTTDDPDRKPHNGAPDVGDANVDSDSDAYGTGEHATVGRDYPIHEGCDISTDRVVDARHAGLGYSDPVPGAADPAVDTSDALDNADADTEAQDADAEPDDADAWTDAYGHLDDADTGSNAKAVASTVLRPRKVSRRQKARTR